MVYAYSEPPTRASHGRKILKRYGERRMVGQCFTGSFKVPSEHLIG